MINGLKEEDELEDFINLIHLSTPEFLHCPYVEGAKLKILCSENKGGIDTGVVGNKLVFSLHSGCVSSGEKIWEIFYPSSRYLLIAFNGDATLKEFKKFLKKRKRIFSVYKQLPLPSGFEGTLFYLGSKHRDSGKLIFPKEDVKNAMKESELAKEIYHYVFGGEE